MDYGVDQANPFTSRRHPDFLNQMATDALRRTPHKWLALALLWVVLGGGLWLRSARLGQLSFDTDEFDHVVAAQQILRTGEPTLPSGNQYDRALGYTHLVQVSFQLFGVSEAAARLPSVICGTLLVLVTYLVGRRWLGVWPALLAAALVASSPLLVAPSRMCRMYSLFHCLYLGICYAYERGWEAPNLSLRRRTVWSAAALVLLLVSLHIHVLTLDFFPALTVYWAILSFSCWRSRYSIYLLITVTVLLISASTGLLNFTEIWASATYVPTYAADSFYPLHYIFSWAIQYPWLLLIVPLAAVFQCVRYGRTRPLHPLSGCNPVPPPLVRVSVAA